MGDMIMGFWFLLAPAAILGGGAWLLWRIFGGRCRHNDDEARVIQESHDMLARMEKRVEALETLLLDRADRADRADPEAKWKDLERDKPEGGAR